MAAARAARSRRSRRSCRPTTGATVFDVVAEGLAEIGRAARRVPPRVARGRRGSVAARAHGRCCSTRSRRATAGASHAARRPDPGAARAAAPTRALGALSGGWRRRVALAQALVARARPAAARRADQPPRHRGDPVARGTAARVPRRRAVRDPRPRAARAPRDAHRRARSRRAHLVARRLPDASSRSKAAALEEEARHAALFDKKLAQEEVWIRQGIKARRTRNEGRVRALRGAARGARARGASSRARRGSRVDEGAGLGQARGRGEGRLVRVGRARRSCATSRCASCAATASA